MTTAYTMSTSTAREVTAGLNQYHLQRVASEFGISASDLAVAIIAAQSDPWPAFESMETSHANSSSEPILPESLSEVPIVDTWQELNQTLAWETLLHFCRLIALILERKRRLKGISELTDNP